jgi:hypothetical protein
MKTALLTLVFGFSLCFFTGCGESSTNIIEDASQEDLDNYDKLIEAANNDLAGDAPDTAE